MTETKIHMVGIGLGHLEHLTQGAREKMLSSAFVYVMAAPDSWMVRFVADLVGSDRVRPYMPASVKWNCGWHRDPVFARVVDEVGALVRAGNHVSFAMAGDVAIYGNIADSVIPLLKARGLRWDVFPGISFLNAISMLTGEPIVGEADNFLVSFAENHEQLDAAFSVANVLVLYNPGGTRDLRTYIETRKLSRAVGVMHGVYGSEPSCVDLLTDKAAAIRGLVLLKREVGEGFAPPAEVPDSSRLPFHIGGNGWNSRGQLFAAAYPDRLLWSESGEPSGLVRRYVFPDKPDDIRGFFIDSRDTIYVSLKGHKKGRFGRTYASNDRGRTFEQILGHCCWAFDEDGAGNLFAGVYHEKGEPDGGCILFWSGNRGRSWVDIAPDAWRGQNHVHHLAVAPDTGWLYATLGDVVGLRGCWRAKTATWTVAADVSPGQSVVLVTGGVVPAGGFSGTDSCFFSGGGRAVVLSLEDGKLLLKAPLERVIEAGERIIFAPWRLKVADTGNAIQFVGMGFRGREVFLGNDTAPQPGEPRVIVFRVADDGSDEVVSPLPSLQVEESVFGWGCFYLEKDHQDTIWAALRPIKGRGALWKKAGEVDWEQVLDVPEEDLPCWRGTHTFRDGTLGQTGDGRYLSRGGTLILPEQCFSRSV